MKDLQLDKIETSIQCRYRMDPAVIDDYTQAMKDNAAFPPLDVFRPAGSQRFILGDGHHRWHAAQKAKKKTFRCRVHNGGPHEALHFALSANSAHGLRRSSADKRKCVLMAMNDPEYDKLSLRQMGELCRVSHAMCSNIRQEINEKAEALKAESKLSEKDKKKKKQQAEPPSQKETELMELRDAMTIIRAFPYSGKDAAKKFKLTKDDVVELTYAVDWLMELWNHR